ncbi:hypothetical protein EDEG_00354 [Edhazardia aedis USNM 41457]|uniref:Uncharacterized protein n=1 Tax=Edhazardia aedis (strain USNM 41457) TaxID=1003232 RepID=J8ZPZ3_EDHAE|nr:hypothetical protein EDEG_00354 [Edhazardia aedis USNM 41457]|eukprot:EJW01763.1 hypothetical protein EDEG_00354 [Edhazardia aedis USNM 41457]
MENLNKLKYPKFQTIKIRKDMSANKRGVKEDTEEKMTIRDVTGENRNMECDQSIMDSTYNKNTKKTSIMVGNSFEQGSKEFKNKRKLNKKSETFGNNKHNTNNSIQIKEKKVG